MNLHLFCSWIRTIKRLNIILFFYLILGAISGASADENFAKDPSEISNNFGQAFTYYIENDTRRIGGPGSDQAYSNGFKFAYTYAQDKIPLWALPTKTWSERLHEQAKKMKTNFGISIAQQLYTPSDTSALNLITDDRPYAGWLYLGFSAIFCTDTQSHSFELDVGTVGSTALGREFQNGFHRMIGEPGAQGWVNQIKNEPTLQLSYQQRLRFLALTNERRNYFDIIPYFGLSAGNVLIGSQLGGVLRVGYNLPDDFGPARPSSMDGDSYINPAYDYKDPNNWSFFGFLGGKGNAVLRNIFLDGNTINRDYHVTKHLFTGESEFGFGAQFYHWSFVWRFVTRSPEFEEKNNFNSFASISVTYSAATTSIF